MKILLRLIMVCALLSGLAYGSYAFGRYVLSTKLFAGTITPNPHSVLAGTSAQRVSGATGRTNYQGGAPRVQIDVLPADAAGPGPEPPPADVLTHELESGNGTRVASTRRATPPSAKKRGSSGSRAFDKDSGLSALGEDGTGYDADGNPLRGGRYGRGGRYSRYGRSDTRDDNRYTRRRRRTRRTRVVRSADANTAGAATSSVTDDGSFSAGDSTPSRAESNDSGSSRAEAPRLDRTERRTRRTESNDRPARSTRSESHQSPVPRPESDSGGSSGSSSGGDSPVPQPE